MAFAAASNRKRAKPVHGPSFGSFQCRQSEKQKKTQTIAQLQEEIAEKELDLRDHDQALFLDPLLRGARSVDALGGADFLDPALAALESVPVPVRVRAALVFLMMSFPRRAATQDGEQGQDASRRRPLARRERMGLSVGRLAPVRLQAPPDHGTAVAEKALFLGWRQAATGTLLG